MAIRLDECAIEVARPEAVVHEHLDRAISAQRRAHDEAIPAIVEAARLITAAFEGGHKLLLCGNGGSAADCQHMAAEFVSRLSADRDRRALPAMALTTDTSFLTAHANDYDFESVFERQIEAFGEPGDVLIAISTSGSSANIVRAVKRARLLGVSVVGLFGAGAPLRDLVHTAIEVQGGTAAATQECFVVVEHAICEVVEELLFG
ncbi:MAG: SIS domain-containing protein, partial [Candidatus Dormibacteraeota bacterium]|nr:SIS domain-containing protein [Candidatus Dormibacteraeota bacterium]